MLTTLISNASVEKVLFFLLLNQKCYASQLCQRFKSPLTPMQYALLKLEKGGVVTSRYEGKTRFFEFNPDFPLLTELTTLLRKAYTLLPIDQKKLYYLPTFPNKPARPKKGIGPQSPLTQKALLLFWNKLSAVQNLCFSAKSKSISATGWNGLGKGSVEVKQESPHLLIFHEKGTWISEENQKEFEFSNVFRWTLHSDKGAIQLEHLRFGFQNPVFLFSFIPIDAHTLESMDSHECKDDSYFGQVRCDKHFVQLNWRVVGPKKNEEIDYLYT